MAWFLPAAIGLGAVSSAISSYYNYKNQKDQLNWQKGQWEEQKMREDTATQRKVADLKAAGLSPTLAAGQASPVSAAPTLQAPQIDPKSQLTDMALNYMQMASMDQQISASKTQEKLTEAQIIKSGHEVDEIRARILKENADAYKSGVDALSKKHDLDWYKKNDLPSNASSVSKTAGDIGNKASTAIEKLKQVEFNLKDTKGDQLKQKNKVDIQKYKELRNRGLKYKSPKISSGRPTG